MKRDARGGATVAATVPATMPTFYAPSLAAAAASSSALGSGGAAAARATSAEPAAASPERSLDTAAAAAAARSDAGTSNSGSGGGGSSSFSKSSLKKMLRRRNTPGGQGGGGGGGRGSGGGNSSAKKKRNAAVAAWRRKRSSAGGTSEEEDAAAARARARPGSDAGRCGAAGVDPTNAAAADPAGPDAGDGGTEPREGARTEGIAVVPSSPSSSSSSTPLPRAATADVDAEKGDGGTAARKGAAAAAAPTGSAAAAPLPSPTAAFDNHRDDEGETDGGALSAILRHPFWGACWPHYPALTTAAASPPETGGDPLGGVDDCLVECGDGGAAEADAATAPERRRRRERLEDIEDPTAQESIECVFSSARQRLEGGRLGPGPPDFFSWEGDGDGDGAGVDAGDDSGADDGMDDDGIAGYDYINACADVDDSGGGGIDQAGWDAGDGITLGSAFGSSRNWSARAVRHADSGGLVFIGTRRVGARSSSSRQGDDGRRGTEDEERRDAVLGSVVARRGSAAKGLCDGDNKGEGGSGSPALSARGQPDGVPVSSGGGQPAVALGGHSATHPTSIVSARSRISDVDVRCDRPCPLCSSARAVDDAGADGSRTRTRRVPPPHLLPDGWPQGNLLLRPTPGRGMRVRGVRYAGERTYVWRPLSSSSDSGNGGGGRGGKGGRDGETEATTWWDHLLREWARDDPTLGGDGGDEQSSAAVRPGCPECCILPVNNGNESPGKSLVVDFESPLFVGTLLLRIRNSSGTTPHPYDDSQGYFAGMNRRYQAVIRGRFTRDGVPMTECVTGQSMDRKFGRLPPKLVLRGAMKVASFFAPQVRAKLDGPRPECVSPLGSTPQSIMVRGLDNDDGKDRDGDKDRESEAEEAKKVAAAPPPHGGGADESLEPAQSEPADPLLSLLRDLPGGCDSAVAAGLASARTSLARAKVRKRAFDRLYASSASSGGRACVPTFRTDAVYTFEFLQHLIDFDDLSVDLGTVLGKVRLGDMLDGQPIRCMAEWEKRRLPPPGGKEKKKAKATTAAKETETETIWSFDIWHSCLHDDAERHDRKGAGGGGE